MADLVRAKALSAADADKLAELAERREMATRELIIKHGGKLLPSVVHGESVYEMPSKNLPAFHAELRLLDLEPATVLVGTK